MPLLLGSGSTCDVCLDAFDADICAPCSIECGHIFCLKCLNALSRSKCPLCRSRFEPQSVVKLHIDVDEVRPPSQAHDGPRALSDDQVVANSYQERIASACNEGSSEPALRQLIDECRQFLGQQPRNSFSDLRVSLRMINHVYNIKLDQLKHRQEIKRLTDDIASLQTDKANLEKMVKEIEDEHKQERDAWQAHETNLREFCSKAQGAYFGVAELYLKAENERSALRDTLRQLGHNAPYMRPTSNARIPQIYAVPDLPPATDTDEATPADLDQLPPPSGDLFSPIPELPEPELEPPSPKSDSGRPLHSDNDDKAPQKLGPIPRLARCGRMGCPFTCQCQSVDLFDDPSSTLSSVTKVASHATGGWNYAPPPLISSSNRVSPSSSASSLGRSGISLKKEESTAPERQASPTEAEAEITHARGTGRPIPVRTPSYNYNPRMHDIASQDSSSHPSSLPTLAASGSHFPASLSAQHAETLGADASKPRSGSPRRSRSRLPPADLTMSSTKECGDNDSSTGSQPRSSTASEQARAHEKLFKERGRSSKNSERSETTFDPHSSTLSSASRLSHHQESSRPRSRSHRREEDGFKRQSPPYTSSSMRPRDKERDRTTPTVPSGTMLLPSMPNSPPPRTPSNIYRSTETPNWASAASYDSHYSSLGSSKGKMAATSIKTPATYA